MPRRPPQTIEALVLKMHRTRVQAETLRKQMAACECQREERQNGWPCWKATWIPPEYDNSMDAPRLAFRGYWDHAGGNAEEGEDIERLEPTIEEALAMIEDGRIRDGKTIMLLQHAALHLFA